MVPYAPEALVEWLEGKPDEFCSSWTARAMAMAAYTKAAEYDPRATVCGVACTASLASDRPKRGAHRAYLAFQNATTTAVVSVELEKGRRTRAEEESLVTALVLNLVAEACGVTGRVEQRLESSEAIQADRVVAPAEQQDLLAGRVRCALAGGAGQQMPPKVVLCGAFHPLHQAHRRMAELARSTLGAEVAFEMSIQNVDKPPLDFMEIGARLRQFLSHEAVWLTRAPTFVEKAELFPGATFVVGADTIARVADARYYGGQQSLVDAAIDTIASAGCRFLVFGRTVDGEFRTVRDLRIPAALARICQEVPESVFRDEISSTRLRNENRHE